MDQSENFGLLAPPIRRVISEVLRSALVFVAVHEWLDERTCIYDVRL